VKGIEQTQSNHSLTSDDDRTISQLLTITTSKSADSTGVAMTYIRIGDVYDSVGNYKKALAYYKRALKTMKREFKDESHPDICLVRGNITRVEETLKHTT
jgi:tetratricopeptide (TPR) repeat protein